MKNYEPDNLPDPTEPLPERQKTYHDEISFDGFSDCQNSPHAAFMIDPDPMSSSESLFMSTPTSRSTHWSIAWSDLMMTMFVLFMVMFIYKSADKEFLSGEGLGFTNGKNLGLENQETEAMGSNNYFQYANKTVSRIYDISRQLIREEEIKEFASIDLEADRTLRIILKGDLLFDSGDVNMKQSARSDMQQIAKVIQNTPYMINVIGHTDDLPVNSTDMSNWELSALRASSVARFLINQTGLPPSHFYVTGHSSYQPVAPNDSAENRAQNRRVEIVLTKLLPLQAPTLENEIKQEFSVVNTPPQALLASTSTIEKGVQ